MKQYCRYCSNMVCGDANYCTEKEICKTDKQLKQSNKCNKFEFNPIDALSENEKGYVPRKKKIDKFAGMDYKQMALLLFGTEDREVNK